MILRLITMAAAATATAEHSRGLHIGVRLREVSDLLPVLRVKYCERGYYRKKGMVEKEDEVEESENEEPEEANERRRRRIRQQNLEERNKREEEDDNNYRGRDGIKYRANGAGIGTKKKGEENAK